MSEINFYLFISKVSRGQVPLTCSQANKEENLFMRDVTLTHVSFAQKEGSKIVVVQFSNWFRYKDFAKSPLRNYRGSFYSTDLKKRNFIYYN